MADRGKSKDAATGPNYSSERFRNPYNGNRLDTGYGKEGDKTIVSPTSTFEGAGVPLRHDYDDLWEGK